MDATKNIEIIRAALLREGILSSDITLGDMIFTQFTKDGKTRWLTYQTPALSYPTTHNAIRELSRNKTIATSYVERLGYRTPKSLTVGSMADLNEAHQMLEYAPLVTKPEYGSLSRDVTRGITETDELDSKFLELINKGDRCVIQEQVIGEEARLVVINKKLEAAILRKRPFVVGDGEHTVAQLVELENHERESITDTMVKYPQLTNEMCNMQDVDFNYIPTHGEEVVLGYGTMIMNGASMYDIVNELHPGYREMVESIASDLNADFIVVDVVIRDPGSFEDYWFIEFNTSPVLKLFYSCRDGKHFDVGRYLAEMIDGVTKDFEGAEE